MHRSGYMAFNAPALLFAKGVHPKFVQTLFAQANISVTMDLYSHWACAMGNQDATAIEDAFRRHRNLRRGQRDRCLVAYRRLRYGCSKLGQDVSRPVPLSCIFYLQTGIFWRADERT